MAVGPFDYQDVGPSTSCAAPFEMHVGTKQVGIVEEAPSHIMAMCLTHRLHRFQYMPDTTHPLAHTFLTLELSSHLQLFQLSEVISL